LECVPALSDHGVNSDDVRFISSETLFQFSKSTEGTIEYLRFNSESAKLGGQAGCSKRREKNLSEGFGTEIGENQCDLGHISQFLSKLYILLYRRREIEVHIYVL
jgi:hypothetical protein